MKIGIDATFSPHGGSLGHLLEFIREFSCIYSKSDLILYTKTENIELLGEDIVGRCTLRIVRSAFFGNFFRILWGQLILPFLVKTDGIDVLFCPGNISPIVKTTKIKAQWIATVGPFLKDAYVGLGLRGKFLLIVNKYIIKMSAYTSNVVIHESLFSKQLFENEYGYPSENQFLIECGKDHFFTSSVDKVKSSNVIGDITCEDLLCVSHLYPYKNLERLIEAVFLYKNKYNSELKLYVAGKKADLNYVKRLEKQVAECGLKDDVIFTGVITKAELKFAYSKCKLFVFPSLCESSGYTLIEAMSCGAAILASDRTAIPHTCKNGAQYFDAYKIDDLISKLETILADETGLIEMRKESLIRASEMIDYKTATKDFIKIISDDY